MWSSWYCLRVFPQLLQNCWVALEIVQHAPNLAVKGKDIKVRLVLVQHILDQATALLRQQVIAIQQVQGPAVGPSKVLTCRSCHTKATTKGLEDHCWPKNKRGQLLSTRVGPSQSNPAPISFAFRWLISFLVSCGKTPRWPMFHWARQLSWGVSSNKTS